jgi:ketosteroid isomerase-like protein
MDAKDVVRSHYDALQRRDMIAALSMIDEDIVWTFAGPPSIPFAGRWVGLSGVREFFHRLRTSVEIREFQVERIVADGQSVLVLGRERFVVRATGKQWSVRWVQIHEVRAGRIVRFDEYTDTATIAAAYSK